MKILIYYRNCRLLESLSRKIRSSNNECDIALSATDLLAKAMLFRYDAVILDLGEMCESHRLLQEILSHNRKIKIIVYHQNSTTPLAQLLYDCGAHLVKQEPHQNIDCLNDIETVCFNTHSQNILRIGDLILDHSSRKVCRAGTDIRLRNKEFSLLSFLMKHGGVALSRDFILENVWDRHSLILTNTVDVHIYWLRKKIDYQFARKMIKTIPCIGYMIDAQASAERFGSA